MKKLSLILIIIMILSLFAACEGIGDDLPNNETKTTEQIPETLVTEPDILPIGQRVEMEKQVDKFAFSFAVDKTEYLPGEVILVRAQVTNISGEDHVYVGSFSEYMAGIILYWQTENGEIGGRLEHDPIPMTEDIGTHTVENGKSSTVVYSFTIPNDAKFTSYSISLSYNSETALFEDVIKIVDRTSSEAAHEYDYCTTSILSGAAEINPIEVYIGYSEYKNNKLVDVVEIAGYEYIFGMDEYAHGNLPILVLDGGISERPPVNVKIYGVAIYDTDYNRLKYSFDSLYELDELPAGEYVIIYYEEADGRGCDPEITDFRINKSVGVFKLVVPEISVPAFSFADDSRMYKKNDPGVKTDGFKNISGVEIKDQSDAVERAKIECTVGYDTESVYFDSDEKVWKVVFSTKYTLGGCQSVYLDKNGVTLLIVYGE